MKEQPLFAPGQAIRCVDNGILYPENESSSPLIEGRKYYVDNPFYEKDKYALYITLVGWPAYQFSQELFIPDDFDRYAEETFHQSLKGKPVNA